MKKFFLVFGFVLISTAVFAAIPVKLTIAQGPADLVNFNKVTVFGPSGQIKVCVEAVCTVQIPAGTKLTLTANGSLPNTDFFRWTKATGSAASCALSTNHQCTFTITQETQAEAAFKRVRNLKVQLGEGDGKIVVKRGHQVLFECTNRAPLACSTGVFEGDRFRIEAIALNLSQFQKFTQQTGNMTVCTGQGATFFCEFSITQDSSLVANFIPIP